MSDKVKLKLSAYEAKVLLEYLESGGDVVLDWEGQMAIEQVTDKLKEAQE